MELLLKEFLARALSIFVFSIFGGVSGYWSRPCENVQTIAWKSLSSPNSALPNSSETLLWTDALRVRRNNLKGSCASCFYSKGSKRRQSLHLAPTGTVQLCQHLAVLELRLHGILTSCQAPNSCTRIDLCTSLDAEFTQVLQSATQMQIPWMHPPFKGCALLTARHESETLLASPWQAELTVFCMAKPYKDLTKSWF